MDQNLLNQLIDTIVQRLQEPNEIILAKPEIFEGKEAEDPEKWIEAFIRIAEANNWSEARWINIVGGFLRGTAANWYSENKRHFSQWNIDGEENNFTEMFIERFTSPLLKIQWHMQYLTLRQGTETIDEFANKFKELKKKVDPENTTLQEILVRDFLLRLNPEIQVLAFISTPTTLNEAINITRNIEAGIKLSQSRLFPTKTYTPVQENFLETQSDSKEGKRVNKRRRYYGCRKKGHEVKECSNSPSYNKPLQIHEEIFTPYQEIMTKDPNTPKESSTNIHSQEETEVEEKELANTLTETCRRIQEKFYTTPVSQQYNYIEKWSEVQEELLKESSRKSQNLEQKECPQLKNKYDHKEQHSGRIKQQWKTRKKINQHRF